MLNEDDLRPGDVVQDAKGDFWHVHDDGKIWCSEPGARISFEHARSAGPFTRSIGSVPIVEKCINDGWQIRPFGTEVGTRWCFDVNDAIDRARDAEDECRYWTAAAEAIELKQNTDPVESLAGEFKNAAHDAHEGKWTRDDLPRPDAIRFVTDDVALDLVVDHLNAHHPKPAPDLLSSAAECVLDAEERVRAAKRERDAAVARAEAAGRVLRERDEQEDDATRAACERAEQAENARDTATTRAEQLEKALAGSRDAHQRSADAHMEWKARAEKAEADRENIAEEFADFRVEVVAEAVKYRESNPQASGDDPAVYVVRESDIAAVEIERDERGWHGPGTTWTERSTSGEVRAHAEGLVRNVARCEAVARAIEAEPTVDPIEEKAIAAFKVAWHEADMHGDEGNRTRRGIRAARKVIDGASGE